MKKTKKITFGAIMAALAAAVMLLSYFPYLTYAIPAMAGLFRMVALIEINRKWALAAYISSAIPVLLLAESESKLLYVMFFGYYPIIKAVAEALRKPLVEWLIKIAVFNVAVLASYLLFSKMFGISMDDFGVLGKYGAWIFLASGNVVFVLYDIAVSRMAMFYLVVIKPKLKM